MLKLGCHLSIARGYAAMGRVSQSIGANMFQFFMTNPRGGRSKIIDVADAASLRRWMADRAAGPLLCHAPYTINLCAADEGVRDFAATVMERDLFNMDRFFPGNFYNVHPGCHVGQGIERGIGLIVESLSKVLARGIETTVLLETMSGKGTEIGAFFEELAAVIAGLGGDRRLGVCLDTCHAYSAGYDLVGDLDGVLENFDRTIGLDRLKAIHLNDSMTPFGSRKDRHALLGQGSLGFEALVRLMGDDRLRDLPFCLETPNEPEGYAREMAALREALNEPL